MTFFLKSHDFCQPWSHISLREDACSRCNLKLMNFTIHTRHVNRKEKHTLKKIKCFIEVLEASQYHELEICWVLKVYLRHLACISTSLKLI